MRRISLAYFSYASYAASDNAQKGDLAAVFGGAIWTLALLCYVTACDVRHANHRPYLYPLIIY